MAFDVFSGPGTETILPGTPIPIDARRTRRRRRKMKVEATEIVDRVMRFYEEDDTARDNEREARIQRYAKYRLWTEGKTWPWANSSDIGLPDMMEKALRLQDTLHNAVMATRPVT